MPEYYMTWKSDSAHWIALVTCPTDPLLQTAENTAIRNLSNVLAEMARRARYVQDWEEFRAYSNNKILHFCMRYGDPRYDETNAEYLEKIMRCIEGLTPMSTYQMELLDQRVELWRPILLCTDDSNLERDIRARLVQTQSIPGYSLSGLFGRPSDAGCEPLAPGNIRNTY